MTFNRIKATCATLALLGGFSAWSMPPKPGLHSIAQPDGTRISVYMRGDEHRATYLSEDGRLLLPDSCGTLRYATFGGADGSTVVASDIAAAPAHKLTDSDRRFLATLNNDALIAAHMAAPRPAAATPAPRKASRRVNDQITDYPASGERKVLVVLAAFSDKKFVTPDPATTFSDMLNKEGYADYGADGSARDYFIDNSSGLYKPEMVVYGPVVLPHNMAYYGAMTSTANDARPQEMIRDACQLLDNEIDFREYDLDGDGYIDNVYLFYPGYSQAECGDPNTVWPHASYAWNKLHAEFDGVKLDHYACSNEIEAASNNPVGIGTFCHEFTHVLGLPDLYATNASHQQDAGEWSLMASGGYNNNGHTPPNLTAYERYALGWLEPTEAAPTGQQLCLPGIESNKAYRISTSNPNEYYLIENRQQKGWDRYIPGHGMLIWHIDYDKKQWAANTVNNDVAHQRIELVEADGLAQGKSHPGNAYPGTTDATCITGNTLPGFRPFGAEAVALGLYNIKEVTDADGSGDTQVLCNVMNTSAKLPAPEVEPATEVTPVAFTINWREVEGADAYVVDVYRKVREGSFVTKIYEPGYRLIETTGHSLKVENLQPATDYHFAVRAMGGASISDYCAEQTATTLDKDFTFMIPETDTPGEITSTSFRASWQPLDEAEAYLVSVYEADIAAVRTERNDIAGGIAAPGQWASSSSSTSPFPGYYGAEAPGLTMTANDDFLRSPLCEGLEVTRVKFWYRGTSQQDHNLIEVMGYTSADEWKTIGSIGEVERDKEGYTAEFVNPAYPCNAAVIAYRRPFNAGSIAIDDVEVEYSATTLTPLEAYTEVNAGNALTLEVSGLKPSTRYRYEVRALDGANRFSRLSVGRNVSTTAESGIAAPGEPAKDYRIAVSNGRLEVSTTAGTTETAQVYGVCGTLLHTAPVGPGAAMSWQAPARGVYILRLAGLTRKLII